MTVNQSGRISRAARWQWAATLLVALVTMAAGTPRRYEQLRNVTPDANTTLGQLTPAEAARMNSSGLSTEAYAAYFTGVEVLTALVGFSIAALIMLGRPHEWMGLLVSHSLIACATILPLASALEAAHPVWAAVILGWRMAFAGLLVPLLLLFPDGRFAPRWTRWLALIWIGYILLWLIFPPLRPPFSFGGGLAESAGPGAMVTIGTILVGVANQLWRYARVSNPVERQRTKWVVVGFVVMVAGLMLGTAALTYLTVAPIGFTNLAARLAGPTLMLAGFIVLALMIGFSALRYRLWDVDIIIRRTLIYSALTTVLALAYFGSVLLLQTVFAIVSGESRNELVTVLSTLAIAALFVPVRGRVQGAIDRRFYRKKYDAARTLAAFGAQARDVVELEQLERQLVRVVDETMQPRHVALWVRESERT